MARAKTVHSVLPLGLTVLDRALLSYYAHKLRTDQAKIVRAMVREYIRRDRSFQPDEFKRYVEKELIRGLEPGAAAELKDRSKQFASSLGQHGGKKR